MKCFRILFYIALCVFPSSMLWASEPGIGWTPLSVYTPGPYEEPGSARLTGLGNNIYVLTTTYDFGASTHIAHHDCYDLGTNTWSNKTTMNVLRQRPMTAVVNGKIYSFGGEIPYSGLSDAVEEYDPAADTWAIRSPLPVKKKWPNVAVVNNKIYIIGGLNDAYQNTISVEEYDPAADIWTAKAPIPVIYNTELYTFGYIGFSSLVYNNKIYVFSINNYVSITLQIYDPLADTWENKVTVNLPEPIDPAATVLLDNKIYLVGSSTYLYNPVDNSYKYLSYCQSVQNMTNIVTLNNSLYTSDYYGKNLYRSVFGHQPVLAYTGAAGYEQDAIEPDEMKINARYTFKIKYYDEDNDPPSYGPRLNVILTDANYMNLFNYIYLDMEASDPLDTNYADGKEYTCTYQPAITGAWPGSFSISTSDEYGLFTYLANDLELKLATTEYPSFSRIEVTPNKGFYGKTLFTFRVKYTDPNNIPPTSEIKVQLGNYNFYTYLTEEDIKDKNYRDGKYYTGQTYIYKSGDLTVRLKGSNELLLEAAEAVSETFTVTDQALSDLNVWLYYVADKLSAGLPFTHKLQVSNSGTGECAMEAEYYLSPAKSLTGAYQLKVLSFPNRNTIPIDEDVDLTYEVHIPASVPPGSYYLGVLCKSNNDLYGDELVWYDTQTQVLAGTLSDSPGQAYCFPSPAYLSKGDMIHFALVPADAEVSIMLQSGSVIKKFTADGNGYVPPWDGSTDSNGKIGSGIYLVHINAPSCSTKKLFKILVFR
ncbi:MAG: hypothetical protein PHR23_01160 [bacterium]|nr:hypothetical protein [bacterium]